MKNGLYLILLAQAAVAGDAPGDFLSELEGPWRGRAVHTPVGPIPYNVNFSKSGVECIRGIVSNRLSQHTWAFCNYNERLSLRFLTDFRGNDIPIHFAHMGETDGVHSFYTDSHPFMRLQAFVDDDRGWITVMHHGKLHVEIHLSRESQ